MHLLIHERLPSLLPFFLSVNFLLVGRLDLFLLSLLNLLAGLLVLFLGHVGGWQQVLRWQVALVVILNLLQLLPGELGSQSEARKEFFGLWLFFLPIFRLTLFHLGKKVRILGRLLLFREC
mmetsp:Transcript_43884/g.42407  ORF Transcript_43884/g.42407 Transcript_43884/m.42407 type:complete len:121 (-) Transcript_43884:95-457(-)